MRNEDRGEIARASGISNKLVVVFDKILESTADVAVRENIVPLGV
tara:strand:+ start:1222 stop:1356 length:135 start_codon:yes stop_codon:yes gene_type:complete